MDFNQFSCTGWTRLNRTRFIRSLELIQIFCQLIEFILAHSYVRLYSKYTVHSNSTYFEGKS